MVIFHDKQDCRMNLMNDKYCVEMYANISGFDSGKKNIRGNFNNNINPLAKAFPGGRASHPPERVH